MPHLAWHSQSIHALSQLPFFFSCCFSLALSFIPTVPFVVRAYIAQEMFTPGLDANILPRANIWWACSKMPRPLTRTRRRSLRTSAPSSGHTRSMSRYDLPRAIIPTNHTLKCRDNRSPMMTSGRERAPRGATGAGAQTEPNGRREQNREPHSPRRTWIA